MLKCDSRLIAEGDTFIAIKGELNDGHQYIEDAIAKGAKRIICEYGNYEVETIRVASTKEYLIKYLKENMPNIKIIGVTGTNGKTTTCYLIWQIFNKLGVKCAYIGTLGFYLDKKIKDLNNTTPGSIELFNLINEAYNQKYEYVVMEVSSQALAQNRVDFISYDYAIFTNLTQDHLDYHKSMENYIIAKQRLFHLLKSSGVSLINNDDLYVKYFEIKNISYEVIDNFNINVYGEVNISKMVMDLSKKKCIIEKIYESNETLENYYINLIGSGNYD